MSRSSQDLIFRLAEHLGLLHADQADILGHFGDLERLIEDYRTFIAAFDLTGEHDKQRQVLFQRTHELLGEKPIGIISPAPREQEQTPIYRFQVDKDKAERKEQ